MSSSLPRNSSRTSLSRQASTVSSATGESTTIAIGIDLGSFNCRIGMYDDTKQHPVVVSNRDGHRTTHIILDAEIEDPIKQKEAFFQRIMTLAVDAAHTKDLHVVVSVPNNNQCEEWTKVLLQDKSFNARVITEAAAVCLAYENDESTATTTESPTTTPSSSSSSSTRTLIIDGGAQAIKATILSQTSNGLWKLEQAEETLTTVNGNALLEPLAKFIAQQFELKHRFPRGEVWENSKKARTKIFQACQVGLKTLYINNSSVTIHVDGLYEGIDYQVAVSKPKWEHLSGKLVRETKAFLAKYKDCSCDRVLLSGGLFTWLTPIVKGIFGDKLQTNTSYFDPSEAIAMGCTKQAYYHLAESSPSTSGSNNIPTDCTTTLDVPLAPVSIGIGPRRENKDDDNTTNDDNTNGGVLIEKGTPLPAMVTQTSLPSTSLELWQWEPTSKALCKLEELTDSSVLKLQMTTKGQLRVWVDGETLVF
jgi:molecular chaperone DnaK (HSP70)